MRKALLGLAALVALVGLSACQSGEAAKHQPDAAAQPAAEPAAPVVEAEPEAMTEAEAKVKISALTVDLVSSIPDETQAGMDAMNAYDLDGAARHMRNAAGINDEIVSIVQGDEALAATNFGGETISTYSLCSDALNASADAIEVIDVDALNAATEDMGACSAGIENLTAQL
jgi:hypothetical protein